MDSGLARKRASRNDDAESNYVVDRNDGASTAAYSTGFHGIGTSRYPVAVFSTWATDGNG